MGKNTYSKMNVGPAMKVLSRATASSLRWFHEKYPEEFTYECLTMAKFCEMVGQWFEICAGRNQFLAFHRDDPEKTAQKIDFLKEFIGFYSTQKLHPNQNVDEFFKPSKKGVILSNTSIMDIQERLLNNTANVLCAEYTDVCLRSKFKNKHWLFLY